MITRKCKKKGMKKARKRQLVKKSAYNKAQKLQKETKKTNKMQNNSFKNVKQKRTKRTKNAHAQPNFAHHLFVRFVLLFVRFMCDV